MYFLLGTTLSSVLFNLPLIIRPLCCSIFPSFSSFGVTALTSHGAINTAHLLSLPLSASRLSNHSRFLWSVYMVNSAAHRYVLNFPRLHITASASFSWAAHFLSCLDHGHRGIITIHQLDSKVEQEVPGKTPPLGELP